VGPAALSNSATRIVPAALQACLDNNPLPRMPAMHGVSTQLQAARHHLLRGRPCRHFQWFYCRFSRMFPLPAGAWRLETSPSARCTNTFGQVPLENCRSTSETQERRGKTCRWHPILMASPALTHIHCKVNSELVLFNIATGLNRAGKSNNHIIHAQHSYYPCITPISQYP